ncbi:transposase family protein [Streptomyces sp. cg28]|uniref:transposase family protein n=1 Tax=Streptomyces sp. cg28 TaxID=3403457 RepID=UPI003B228E86
MHSPHTRRPAPVVERPVLAGRADRAAVAHGQPRLQAWHDRPLSCRWRPLPAVVAPAERRLYRSAGARPAAVRESAHHVGPRKESMLPRRAAEPSRSKLSAGGGVGVCLAKCLQKHFGRFLIPHRKRPGEERLGPRQEAENAVHRRARARVEHALSRLKNWKVLRDCRLKGSGVHQAMLGVARLHNMALSG